MFEIENYFCGEQNKITLHKALLLDQSSSEMLLTQTNNQFPIVQNFDMYNLI